MTAPGKPSLANFRFRLVVASILFLLPLKLILAKSSPLSLLLASWAFESCLFLWIYLLTHWLGRIRIAQKLCLAGILFSVLYCAHFLTSFFYTFFFKEAATRKFSLLDFDLDSIAFFFKQVLPWYGFVVFGASMAALLAAALLTRKLPIPLPHWALAPGLVIASVLTIWLGGPLREIPTPVVDVVNNLVEVCSHTRIEPDSGATPARDLERWDLGPSPETQIHTRYHKILIFVMEQITLKTLLSDSTSLPPDSFFRRTGDHAHTYTNFFSCDQDSRTGLLAELSARFVPFEAYRDEDLERYRNLQDRSSLVSLFNESGFTTAFAASETEHEEVVYDLPWAERLALETNDINRAGGFLCFNPYEFEHSCEDKILLPRLFDFVDHHDRVFLFQEFIWGHCSEYYDASQKPAVQYYDEYLKEWWNHLEDTHQLADTLIVVTSDHGIRDWDYEHLLSSYRIPLIFIHPGFDHRETPGLLSQFNFKDVLLSELSGDSFSPPDYEFVPFVGSTTKSIVGAITKDLDLLVVKNRRHFSYVLFHLNAAGGDVPGAPPKNPLTPQKLLRVFSDYRAFFLSKDFR